MTDIYQGSLPTILPFLKARLDLSYTLAGVILMAANFTSSLLQPLFGYLSDKKEKALLLPLGCLAAGLGLTLLPLATNFGTVVLLVVVSGLGVAAYHPEGYQTASFFTGQKKATGMSVFSVGGNLGFALGPILALGDITYLSFAHLPVLLVFALLAAALLWHNLGALHAAKAPALEQEGPAPAATPRAYLALFLVIAVVVMRSWTQMGLMAYIPFYYIDHLKGDALYAGKLEAVPTGVAFPETKVTVLGLTNSDQPALRDAFVNWCRQATVQEAFRPFYWSHNAIAFPAGTAVLLGLLAVLRRGRALPFGMIAGLGLAAGLMAATQLYFATWVAGLAGAADPPRSASPGQGGGPSSPWRSPSGGP